DRGRRIGTSHEGRLRSARPVPLRDQAVSAVQRGDRAPARPVTAAIPAAAGAEGLSGPRVGDRPGVGGAAGGAPSQRRRTAAPSPRAGARRGGAGSPRSPGGPGGVDRSRKRDSGPVERAAP